MKKSSGEIPCGGVIWSQSKPNPHELITDFPYLPGAEWMIYNEHAMLRWIEHHVMTTINENQGLPRKMIRSIEEVKFN